MYLVGSVTRRFLSASKNDRLRLESQVYYHRTCRTPPERNWRCTVLRTGCSPE
ncbi:MAG: hypothetical protein HPZ91_11845 [Lentisphaeria bacterium]|nr:hypothetical protein [Lentisphaeria bacterium]